MAASLLLDGYIHITGALIVDLLKETFLSTCAIRFCMKDFQKCVTFPLNFPPLVCSVGGRGSITV